MRGESVQILLVEDEAAHADLVRHAFASEQVQGRSADLVVASTVKDARAWLETARPALVLADLHLPDGTGLDLVPAAGETASYPVVIITSHGDEQVAVEAIKAGALDYIVKTPETLADLPHIAECTLREWQHITKRREAEEALRRSEIKYAAVFHANPHSIVISSLRSGQFIEVNSHFLKVTGLQREDVIGRTAKALKMWVDPEERARFIAMVEAQGTVQNYEVEMQIRPGQIITGLISAERMDLGGEPCMVTITRNITERKQAEEALRRSEQRYALAARAGLVGVWDWDLDTNALYLDPILKEMLGYEAHEIDDHLDAWQGLVYPGDLERVLAAITVHLEGVTPAFEVEHRMVHRDGSVRWFVCRGQALRDDQGTPVRMVGADTNITERKQIEEVLRNSEERFKILFENAPDAAYLNDLNGVFVDGNRAAEALTGYERKELVGKRFTDAGLLSPSHIARALGVLACNVLGQATGPDEFVLKRKDGRKVPVEIRTYPVKVQGQTLILGLARDISEHKRLEKQNRRYSEELEHLVALRTARIQELERQRAEIEKLAATGRMAAGIAHEINNPLASIMSSFELVSTAIPEEHPRYDFVRRIEKDLDRVATIIRQMYNLYKPVQEAAHTFSVEAMLEEVRVLLEPYGRQREVALVFEATDVGAAVCLPPTSVHQVLFNVVQNAIDASPHGHAVTVVAQTMNGWLRVAVEDNGGGIEGEVRNHIFEPFFSTKHTDSMGLGLAIARSLATAMGGSIMFDSAPGEGTVFHITLPLQLALHEGSEGGDGSRPAREPLPGEMP